MKSFYFSSFFSFHTDYQKLRTCLVLWNNLLFERTNKSTATITLEGININNRVYVENLQKKNTQKLIPFGSKYDVLQGPSLVWNS